MRLRGSLKTKSALAAALRRYNVKALMLGSGDDETAGEGSYKVDWRDEKAPSSGLIFVTAPHVTYQSKYKCLPISNQAASLPHLCVLPC